MSIEKINRRQFLSIAALAGTAAFIGACETKEKEVNPLWLKSTRGGLLIKEGAVFTTSEDSKPTSINVESGESETIANYPARVLGVYQDTLFVTPYVGSPIDVVPRENYYENSPEKEINTSTTGPLVALDVKNKREKWQFKEGAGFFLNTPRPERLWGEGSIAIVRDNGTIVLVSERTSWLKSAKTGGRELGSEVGKTAYLLDAQTGAVKIEKSIAKFEPKFFYQGYPYSREDWVPVYPKYVLHVGPPSRTYYSDESSFFNLNTFEEKTYKGDTVAALGDYGIINRFKLIDTPGSKTGEWTIAYDLECVNLRNDDSVWKHGELRAE